MASQCVLILDFGGQYKELIARRVRECSVYSIVRAGDITADEVRRIAPIGIILTGGPNSVYDPASPHCEKEIFELGIPVLGICYGAQLMAWTLGGKVATCATSEYGKTRMRVDTSSFLFEGLDGLIADVRLEKGKANLAHDFLHVRRGQPPLAAQLFEGGIKFFTQAFKSHRSTS